MIGTAFGYILHSLGDKFSRESQETSEVIRPHGMNYMTRTKIDDETGLENKTEGKSQDHKRRLEMLNPFVVSLAVIIAMLARVLFEIDLFWFYITLALIFLAVLGITFYKNRYS